MKALSKVFERVTFEQVVCFHSSNNQTNAILEGKGDIDRPLSLLSPISFDVTWCLGTTMINSSSLICNLALSWREHWSNYSQHLGTLQYLTGGGWLKNERGAPCKLKA